MKLVRYAPASPEESSPRLGLLLEQGVLDLRAEARAEFEGRPGDPDALAATLFPPNLSAFIALGDVALDAAKAIADRATGGRVSRRHLRGPEQVRFLAPLPRPGKLIGVGLNYRVHADESHMETPKQPLFFAKFATAVVGPGDPVVRPRSSSKLDYEVELAVVIGRRARNVPASEALDHVFGYTIVNDVSARDLQLDLGGQWVAGKACDSFAPMGPAVVLAGAFGDPREAELRLWVNGELRQSARAADMIWPVEELVAYLSTLFTLEPGDVIATGTPPGVGMGFDPPRYLVPGDVMKAEVSGIGVLENPVAGE